MSKEIWDGDYLNRREDADFLIKFLLQQNAAAIKRGATGTSVNVSAPWGAGKTYFLNNMARQLSAQGYRVAEVNAWRDDHALDPMFAVISPILKALGKGDTTTTVVKAITKNLSKIAIHTGIGLASRAAGFFIGKAVDEITKGVGDTLRETSQDVANEYAEDALRSFEEGQAAIDSFRDTLAKVVTNQPTLFVLIDELDRCKPTYAVALLERIKHLFDVPNVIFVVATHTDQLAHTIRAVYGQGFDADRYLLRFFDRTYTFDRPDLSQLVKARWDAEGFPVERLLPFRQQDQLVLMGQMADQLGLWPRDVHQVLAILWSVGSLFDERLPFPALFAFPLVAAYQQRRLLAFNFATDAEVNPDDFADFFNDQPLFTERVYNRSSDAGSDRSTSILDFMNAFRRLVSSSVTESLRASTPSDEYAERFRVVEFSAIHSNMFHGTHVHSILNQLGPTIRKAGRLTVGKASIRQS
ncbi:KAP family P-loop NTPase fold protein [Mesorhizobium sp. BHbsci]